MSKLLWKSLILTTALFAGSTIAPVSAQNSSNSQILDQIDQYNQEGVNADQSQIRSITELRDVSPGDWAYDALRNLVENYDCIEGYPNRTFRGNRALTRYEFAAGLNACLDSISALMVGGGGVDPAELDQLRRLVNEFEAELATLGTRVDNLEGRVAFLEDNQFSTTTKLKGEVIVALTDVFGGDIGFDAGGSTGLSLGDDNNTILGDRVRLALVSSFTGEDTLYTRLAAGNLSAFSTTAGTHSTTTQQFNLGDTGGNDVIIDWAAYYFPIGNAQAFIAGAGGIHSDYADTNNPYFEDYDGGNGSLSAFSSENPIYRIGGGAGAALAVPIGDKATVSLGYLAEEGADPSNGAGLFNGNYAALGQIDFDLNDKVGIGFTYVHALDDGASATFDLGGRSGTGIVGTTAANGVGTARVTNSYGAELAFQPSEKISVSGFFNYTDATGFGVGDDAEIWSYGLGLAFPDLGKEGNVLGIFGGAQPYVGSGDDVPYQVEAFYLYKVNDHISITPGLIWISDAEADSRLVNVDDAFIGTLRTTFTF